MLSVTDLSKTFETATGPLTILDGVNIAMEQGENLALTGPSGSGKSTLLHIIGTLDSPSSGSVSLLGQDPFQLDAVQLAQFRNQNIGFVFQEHHLLPQLTALENTLLPAVAKGKTDDVARKRATELLDRVGLSERIDHRPGQLSGGERQRVAVARAMMNEPSILLADEPTGSLDHANSVAVGKLLIDLQQQDKVTLLCVTHNLELAKQFDRNVRMEDAKLVES